jgi:hypothetical protein
MNGIGLGEEGDVVTVVQYEPRPRIARQHANLVSPFQALAIRCMFGSQLNHGHASRAGQAGLFDGAAPPAWIVVGENVKPKVIETPIANGELL